MTESELYQRKLKVMFKRENIYHHRFEQFGIPDLYLAKNNNVLWAEIKCINRKQRIITPDWRTGQLSWIKKNKVYGNCNICLILYYCGEIYFLPPQEKYTQGELKCQKKTYFNLLMRT
jgi:hypothetical protein